ncbi:MAG: beta-lactamase family protein [Gammaproteobacteria bacterium]|nr:beta-lactamase family protein [Gammaproteobacteria bacterium]MDH5310072.1 beta-lactamase family protein [Gammaproteobacteria bacterium]
MESRGRVGVVSMVLAAVTMFTCIAIAHTDSDLSLKADAAIDSLEHRGYRGSVLVDWDAGHVYHRDSGVENNRHCMPSYWIASITKQFTAVGVLLLHERKILDIRDSIADYLPGVPFDKSGITVFHLLTHTSGLRQQYAADGIANREAALKALLAPQLKTKPGEEFSYANDNYNLLAIILEILSGQSYEAFIENEVMRPAGMTNSGFWGMEIENGTCVPPVATPLDEQAMKANWGFRGATGMRASVRDLHAFMRALRNEKILTKESVEMLQGNHVTLRSGTEIGFNWFGQRNDDGIYMKFSRGQEAFGGNAVIFEYPYQGTVIIAATNAGPAESGEGPVEGWSRIAHKAMAEIFVPQ